MPLTPNATCISCEVIPNILAAGACPVDVWYLRMIPLEKFTTVDAGFEYHTFFCVVDQEFQPKLNSEHLGYAWIDSGTWPRPMHPGLWSTVNFEAVQHKILTIESTVHTSQ